MSGCGSCLGQSHGGWVELGCIKLVDPDTFSGEKVFEMPALSALSALAKAEREDVQLWEAVHFWEITSALLLHFLHCLPRWR